MKYAILLLLCGFTQVFGQYFDWDEVTALDDYVNRDDGYYDYDLIERYDEEGYTMLVFNMTSQMWMDESVTTNPLWVHHLSIAIPDEITYPDAAHLYVGGGSHNDDPPSPGSESRMRYIADFCLNTGAVAAYLKQVPFQPVFFTDTPNTPRTEDQIIARTWRYYIEEIVDDPDVILQLPMTKAAKKAVDTMVEVVQNENGNTIERVFPAGGSKAAKKAVDTMVEVVQNENGNTIERVFPTGYSKRGWVAWLLGCVDPRVFAMAPIVFDIGNWHANLHHHNQAYGGWSWAFTAYWTENVSAYIDHPRAAEVFDDIGIDYIRYNSRLTMPKLVTGGTSDEFFLPDDSHYYFDELSEPKFMLICENADHGLGGHTDRVNTNMMNFFVAVLEGFQFPDISWERLEHGTHADLDTVCNDEMLSVTAWWADTTDKSCENRTESDETVCRRDFRLTFLIPPGANPIEFAETEVLDLGGGLYRVRMDYRDDDVEGPGYRGFFTSMVFPGVREGDELHFSTEIHIIPDNMPYPQCTTEEECRGVLV